MYYDKNFLLQLDQQKNKIIYAKITALTLQELPVETIEGRVTQGSINLDGASAVRRTCSLTIVAPGFDYSNYLWGFNTKFKLEIGVENKIDSRYEDIIWFKQGIYVISSFNTSKSSNNFTITIQGKDKMSRLNGDMGGTINSSVDFGTIEEETQDGIWSIRKIPIKDIIRNMVHQYGGEPLHNIIINDLPDHGLELLEYRYDTDMYLYRKTNSNTYAGASFNENTPCWVNGNEKTFAQLTSDELDLLVNPLHGTTSPVPIELSEEDKTGYYVSRITLGDAAGYRSTPLTYAGDLIANVGESITVVLDKIKNMLGEFEYFYDLDGHFIFQQKQSFINTIYAPVSSEQGENNKEQYIISKKHSEATQYIFNGGTLITAFNNNPNLANLKNDYSIWGQRNAVSGAQIPIHLRYAIDKKPIEYTSISVDDGEVDNYNDKYGTTLTGQQSITYSVSDYDWREIIYQMALDYYSYSHLDDFELKVAAANPTFYPFGLTGYEQYYVDLQGFWRELYYPNITDDIAEMEKKIDDLDKTDLDENVKQEKKSQLESKKQDLEERLENYYDSANKYFGWNKNVYEHPELLNFWFDFLDTEGELSQFSVKAIGSRQKAVNDTNIKAIYFKDTPNILFIKDMSEIDNSVTGYKYIQAPVENMFSISAQGVSAKTKLDELIYQHGYCCESATINCIPIYYLQPNTRVHITDKDTKLDGDYIINKITIPLAYNGTMSLTATKAAEEYLY